MATYYAQGSIARPPRELAPFIKRDTMRDAFRVPKGITLAANDIIILNRKMPADSILVGFSIWTPDGFGTGTTLDVGTEGDPDALTATPWATSANGIYHSTAAELAAVAPTLAAETEIRVTVAAAGTTAPTEGEFFFVNMEFLLGQAVKR